MKKQNRRRFLLFMGQVGFMTILACENSHSKIEKSMTKQKRMEIIRNYIKEILDSGKKITLKWNCGGDQAIVTTYIDGEKIGLNDDIGEQIDIYIINFLNLPDVGEFEMEGNGEIIDEEGKIYLECESILIGYETYSDTGEDFGWKEVNERDDMFSGKYELFTKK